MKATSLINLIKEKVETLPPEQAFLSDLKATVSACNPQRRPSTHFRPSGLQCLRQMYFDKIEAPMDAVVAEYNGTRICETGSCSHESIQYYVSKMKSCGKNCEFIDVETYIKENNLTYLEVKSKKTYETKLYDTRYDLSFLCDGIIKYKGIYYILEIKTETEDAGVFRDAPNPYHANQSIAYSLSLGINRIMWLYEERNFCTPKTFITTITDDDKGKLIMQLETVLQAVKDLTPPPKCGSRKTCGYCIYKTECKKYR